MSSGNNFNISCIQGSQITHLYKSIFAAELALAISRFSQFCFVVTFPFHGTETGP